MAKGLAGVSMISFVVRTWQGNAVLSVYKVVPHIFERVMVRVTS